VAHLKVFGCDAFVHVPEEKRRKLENKEIKCIFTGYKEGMKKYNIQDLSSRRTMYNKYVIFRVVEGKFEP
jgi:hypothetical protein